LSPYVPLSEPTIADLHAIERLPWHVSQAWIERRLTNQEGIA